MISGDGGGGGGGNSVDSILYNVSGMQRSPHNWRRVNEYENEFIGLKLALQYTHRQRDHNEHAENAWHAWYSTPPSYSHSHAHSLISKTFIIPIHSLGLDRPRRFQFSTNAQQFTITHTHRKYLQKKKRE